MKIFTSTSSFARYDALPLRLQKDVELDAQFIPFSRKLTQSECLSLYQDIDGLIAGTEAFTTEILRSARKLNVVSRCGLIMG